MSQVKENSEDRAYRLITESLTKLHKPGDYLFESTLTHDLGMSRTPVATALNRLVSEGLLVKQSKKGCYIPKVSLKDAQDVFAVRRILEIEAMRIIIARNDTAVLDILHKNTDAATLAVRHDNFPDFYCLDLEFHRSLVYNSQNNYIYEAWRRIFIRCNIYTAYFSDSLQQNQFYKENLLQGHWEMLDAMQNRDFARAMLCINAHFDHIVGYAVDNTLVYENL